MVGFGFADSFIRSHHHTQVTQSVSLLREVNMGFVKRYWKEAEEKKIPHWHKCAIVELKTGDNEDEDDLRDFCHLPFLA